MSASFTSDAYTPDQLSGGNEHLLVGQKVTVITGQNILRGAVLGKITASGKYNLSLSAAADGSEVPDLILAEDCDASGSDVEALAYARGDFNQNALTIGTAHTIASIKEGLRVKGITLVDSVGA